MASGIGAMFLAGLQASFSVLLTIFYGVLATQFRLLDGPSAKKLSQLCVKILLPALLVVNLGEQLDIESASRYVPILGKLQSGTLS